MVNAGGSAPRANAKGGPEAAFALVWSVVVGMLTQT